MPAGARALKEGERGKRRQSGEGGGGLGVELLTFLTKMKLYIVAADMGEGPVYVFSSLAAANLYADKEDGVLFEGGEVAGNPSKAWVVFYGEGGCTSGFSGIFLDEASAKNAAQEVEKDDSEGFSFWVSEEETP